MPDPDINQKRRFQLHQRIQTLTKGEEKPVLVCGYDERGNWRKFLAHLESDAEGAKYWVRLVKSLWAFRGKLKAGTLMKSRTARHFEAMAHPKIQYPGNCNKQISAKCAGVPMHNILNQITTIWEFSTEQRLEAITALERWDQQLQQGHMRPTLVATLEE